MLGIIAIIIGSIISTYLGVKFAYRRKCAACGHRHWHHVDSPATQSGHGHCYHSECLFRHASQGACMEFKPEGEK
jgi:hypothetical protein